MDEQLFQLLMDKFENLKEEVNEVKHDVKTLINFRWQVTGGIIVLNVLFGIVIQWGIAYLASKGNV
jgi:hypothetical protein